MFTNCVRSFLYVILTLSSTIALGCGANASKQPANKALAVVEQFLEAWSRGEPSNKFADSAHPIQGTDPDWQAGYRLLSFLTAEAKQSQDQPDRVRCRVALSLQDPKGRKWDKEVVYDVQMGAKSVVSRAAP
jgi:hypothetical protein